jgi:serine/threonine protein kinase
LLRRVTETQVAMNAGKAQAQAVEDKVATGDQGPTPVINPADRVLGRYRLCFEIAAGGMATVYLARTDGHAGFDKMLALKRIHPHLAKEKSFVEMFLDEARIAARINHPNVCHVFDFGEANGVFYIAMEYLAGEPLSRVLKAVWHRPDQKQSTHLSSFAARIVADACEGLHAAHELRDANGEFLNVVHRDVSPHNLFLTYDGSVRVVDFGIASARNRLHNTSTGEVKGKFAYMAPEQLRGKPVDRRADVWSLGVVLWEIVTMKRLFRRKTEMETIFAVASEGIPSPMSVQPLVPEELNEIIMKALTRDPDQRYQSARDLGRDLLKFLARRGELIGPADLAEWMEDLFPDGAPRKRELLEQARTLNFEGLVEPMPFGSAKYDSTGSDILSAVGASVMRQIELPAPTAGRGLPPPAPSAAPAHSASAAAGRGLPPPAPTVPSSMVRTREVIPEDVAVEDIAITGPPIPWKKIGVVLGVLSVAALGLALKSQLVGGGRELVRQAAKHTSLPVRLGASPATDSKSSSTPSTPANGDSRGATPGEDAPGTGGTGKSPLVEGEELDHATGDLAPGAGKGGKKPADKLKPAGQFGTGDPKKSGQGRGRTGAKSISTKPALGSGTVNVVTPGGWAYVFENGKRLGQTPMRVTLPAGSHNLEIRPFGEPPSQRVQVQVEADKEERVVIRIQN